MHEKAKQRKIENKGQKDTRPELVSKLPKKGDRYSNFKIAIEKMCDDLLSDKTITEENKTKIVWLKSRVAIEM